jgi:hypothetical protein
MTQKEDHLAMAVEVPYIADAAHWKEVPVKVLFDIVGKPLLVDVDTTNLITVEREELLRWLRQR